MPAETLSPSRLRAADVLRVGVGGLVTRRFRTALSALGVSIGIAALVGVLGLSESSRADLISELDQLGTNLLTVQAGEGIAAGSGVLPDESPERIGRIGPVEEVSAVFPVGATVRRTDYVDEGETGGISVVAADGSLVDTLNGAVEDGDYLDSAAADYPVVVLGSVAAERLGIGSLDSQPAVWLAEQWFSVVGILESFPLAPDLDRSALIGQVAAVEYVDADPTPSTIYLRTDPDGVEEVREVLPATANPANPEEVEVSRPSDVLAARAAAEVAFTSLFLGLGAVALLVGGIGIANVMIIAVIERRGEIGLRRAMGATQAHIRRQFLTEALVLAGLGGGAGVVLGVLVTAAYSTTQGWQIVIPPAAVIGGLAAAIAIGAVAGLYPAVRAARLAPTDALRTA